MKNMSNLSSKLIITCNFEASKVVSGVVHSDILKNFLNSCLQNKQSREQLHYFLNER
jgi:hypothetical protein